MRLFLRFSLADERSGSVTPTRVFERNDSMRCCLQRSVAVQAHWVIPGSTSTLLCGVERSALDQGSPDLTQVRDPCSNGPAPLLRVDYQFGKQNSLRSASASV